MNQYALPRSDLHRLGREVLSGPPEAALPCNLPDDWLNLIARDLDFALEGIDDPRVRQLRSQVLVFAGTHFQKCHYNSANCSGVAGFPIPSA